MEKISIRYEVPKLEVAKEERLIQQLNEWSIVQKKEGEDNQNKESIKKLGQEDIRITYWNQQKDVINAPSLNRSVEGTIITFHGRAEDIEALTYQTGNGMFLDERRGCLLNEKMAEGLFGSYQIYGQKIQWNGKEYWIRGVVKEKERRWEDEARMYLYGEEEAYQNCEIKIEHLMDTTSVKEVFTLQYGSGFSIWNGYVYTSFAQMLITGSSWIGLFLSVIFFIKNEKKHVVGVSLKKQKRKLLFWSGIMLLQQKWIWGTVTRFFVLPQDWIPTKWSDFSWYYEKFKQLKEQLFLWQESCAGVEYQNIQWYYEKVGLYMLMMGGIWMWIFLHDSLSSRKR